MTFSGDLKRFSVKVEAKTQQVFVGTVAEMKNSIVFGSPLTGAPGQPVDTGNLRDSWQLAFETPASALISTNVEYAEIIENNIRGATFRNHGPHSVKLTIASIQRIVDSEATRLAGGSRA